MRLVGPNGQQVAAAPPDVPAIGVRFREDGTPEITVQQGTSPAYLLVAGALMTRVGFRLLDAAEARAYAAQQETAAVAATLQREAH
jgi:hypothetical protein